MTRKKKAMVIKIPSWDEIPNKPFEGLGPEFSVDANKNLVVNQIDFSKITNRKLSLLSIDTDLVLDDYRIDVKRSPGNDFLRFINKSTGDILKFRLYSDNSIGLELYDATNAVWRYLMKFIPANETIYTRNVEPMADDTYDLGSDTLRFRNLKLSQTIYSQAIKPIRGYYKLTLNTTNITLLPLSGSAVAFKQPYLAEEYDPSTGTWNDITGNFDWGLITDMKNATFLDSGVKSPDGTETHWKIRLYYDLGGGYRYIHALVVSLQHTHYINEATIEASSVNDFSSDVITLLNNTEKVYIWDGVAIYPIEESIGNRRYLRITLDLSTTSTTNTIKIAQIQLLSIARPAGAFETIMPFGWDADKNIAFQGSYVDVPSLRVGGVEVIDSSRNLKNVSHPGLEKIIYNDDIQIEITETSETEKIRVRFYKENESTLKLILSMWGDGTNTVYCVVYIDDVQKDSFSTDASSETPFKRLIDISDLAEGLHTLSIKFYVSGGTGYQRYTDVRLY